MDIRQNGSSRAEINGPAGKTSVNILMANECRTNSLNKRAGIDASTTILGRQGDLLILVVGNINFAVKMIFSIATHTSIATVEHGRSKGVLGVGAPVVVLN